MLPGIYVLCCYILYVPPLPLYTPPRAPRPLNLRPVINLRTVPTTLLVDFQLSSMNKLIQRSMAVGAVWKRVSDVER